MVILHGHVTHVNGSPAANTMLVFVQQSGRVTRVRTHADGSYRVKLSNGTVVVRSPRSAVPHGFWLVGPMDVDFVLNR